MEFISEKLAKWVKEDPDRLLFSFLDIKGRETEKYTYSDFYQRTGVIAANLHHNYDFDSGDRILLAFPPGVEMICAFFACARLGLIPVPVYPPTSHDFQGTYYKLSHIAKDCQALAILTDQDYYWSLKLNLTKNSLSNLSLKKDYLSKVKWIGTEDFRDIDNNDFPERHSDILFLQYTSGSTSEPKGVKVTHDNVLHNCNAVLDHAPIGVSWLPQYHDMGLVGYYLFFVIKGGTTYGFSSIDFIRRPSLWLETITKYRATASSAPNFAYDYCLLPGKISLETLAEVDLSSLTILMTAAEPVRAATYSRFLEFFQPYGLKPKSFYAAYGLAENTLAVTSYGRQILSVDRDRLKENKLEVVTPNDQSPSTTQIMSCGRPLGDITVKIVDPKKHQGLGEGNIGEVWVRGQSKCLGYWNKPQLTKEMFQANISGENLNGSGGYLRTGDLGFIKHNELYICGRAKDMVIVRGLNYFPQDIEKIAEDSSNHIRKGCVVAFDILEEEEKLVVVVGLKNAKTFPDPIKIAAAIRKILNIQPHTITFVLARTVPKTSSGKIRRQLTKQNWQEGKLDVLEQHTGIKEAEALTQGATASPFAQLIRRYALKGDETCSLANAGLDSLDLVVLMNDVKELLKEKGANDLAKQIDLSLIQEITVVDFFELVDQFENSSAGAALLLKRRLLRLQKEHRQYEQDRMRKDVKLTFKPGVPAFEPSMQVPADVLLTGGTGFFGPFIVKGLLEQTDARIHVLVRASDENQGRQRLKGAMESLGSFGPELLGAFDDRVRPVCGDLSQIQLGLSRETWGFLAGNIDTIYHNGAIVNYLFNYDRMRKANVIGTNEILKLAFDTRGKIFNHISTTFTFGWAVKDVLYETDTNEDMDLLDFGYSQTKWVSEQVVKDAMRHGLRARIFRPALISPSVDGSGYNFDIAVRLIAFMINHGVGVDTGNQVSFTPADVAANNIVAISNLPQTIDKTYHVTRDKYSNMVDFTNMITKLTGRKFTNYKLPQFVPEIVNRCTKDDLLFPLLDFLVRSEDNIAAMEFKLYDSSTYQSERNRSEWGKQDPSLEETVRGLLTFMKKSGIISI